jgi:Arc/MetJ-type ribon-helix-helix transcriptional regulator
MLIRRGYAGNRTEAIRHALKAYERQIEDEEQVLLARACESVMEKMESGEMKTIPWEEVRERQNRKRGLK